MPREEILRAGRERSLVGVASLPDPSMAQRCGVVLLNAGLVHRVGPARLWVTLARRLSALGHPALRLDFSGIGDSPDATDSARFETRAAREACAAMDALGELAQVQRFALIGLCSGAEIAFKAALEDSRVCALVLVNAPRFLEEPSAELVASLERKQAARYYWTVALRNPRSWWKALRGRADLGAMAQAGLARLRAMGKRRAPAPESADARAFRALALRGVRIQLVLSQGDWAQDYLDSILGPESAANSARGAVEIAIVKHCDHLLTPLVAQRSLLEHVQRWAADWS